MSRWNSLYIPLHSSESNSSTSTAAERAETITNALNTLLSTSPYTPYDPFGLFPDKSYPQTVKLFVAPVSADETWLKIPAAADSAALDAVAGALSAGVAALCIFAALDGAKAAITVYQHGQQADMVEALTPFAQPDVTALRKALTITPPANAKKGDEPGIPMTALPADMQSMAGTLNQRQVNRMYARMSRHLMSREQRAAAQSLLVANAPDWESAGGYQLRAVMACLGLSNGWMSPDYIVLRDAYQAYTRRRRNPNAHLLPGSDEAMQTVPDALDYRPFFAGVSGMSEANI